MDIRQVCITFTNPKVVAIMLLLGMVLGLLLVTLLQHFAEQWWMATAFVGICLAVAIGFMAWLDQQDWRAE